MLTFGDGDHTVKVRQGLLVTCAEDQFISHTTRVAFHIRELFLGCSTGHYEHGDVLTEWSSLGKDACIPKTSMPHRDVHWVLTSDS